MPERPSRRSWWREPVLNRRAWSWHDREQQRHGGEWWQNAIIYQISPWSFQDSDGDGKGDLGGVIRRLDYLQSLAIDAIWLTPIYESPMDDLGYDITDMRAIGKSFGSMEQFDRLVQLAHQRDLKIVLDMVWNHTSAQHPWFQESRKDRNNRYADWYVWADPAADGGPPNNWRSAFNGESGWKYVDSRKQYYFFNFLESQPDLNWHNPEVRKAVLRRARFWLERGIDGMRLDAVNFYCHDPELRDNPVREPGSKMPDGIDPNNPAAEHCFVNSFCRDETLEFLKPLRELCEEYPGTMLLGEVTLCEDSIELASKYVTGEERCHLAYHSGLHFKEPLSAGRMREVIAKAVKSFGKGGACWIVGNHDYGRTRSYWGGTEHDYPPQYHKMVAAMLLSLPGALCLWQGDELGLPEARIPEDIAPEEIKDPFGQILYPEVKGRDGSRTPMPWQHDAHLAGFSSADEAWLPIPESHLGRAVDLQASDPQSLLNTWRQLLHWRVRQPALEAGDCELLDLHANVLALTREYEEQRLLCLFNISEAPCQLDLSRYDTMRPVVGLNFDGELDQARMRVKLPAWGVMFADLRSEREMHERSAAGMNPAGI